MPSTPRRVFNERKATQVAARFLAAAPGKKMPYISLLKMMYFMDRESLRRWGEPVTNDTYYSLDCGPILSETKDLMVKSNARRGFWAKHISKPKDFSIELLSDPGDGHLSRSDETLIDEIYAKYGHLKWWEIVKKSHDELPEWTNPQGSSIPIMLEDILDAIGFDQQRIEEIKKEVAGAEKMHALLID